MSGHYRAPSAPPPPPGFGEVVRRSYFGEVHVNQCNFGNVALDSEVLCLARVPRGEGRDKSRATRMGVLWFKLGTSGNIGSEVTSPSQMGLSDCHGPRQAGLSFREVSSTSCPGSSTTGH